MPKDVLEHAKLKLAKRIDAVVVQCLQAMEHLQAGVRRLFKSTERPCTKSFSGHWTTRALTLEHRIKCLRNRRATLKRESETQRDLDKRIERAISRAEAYRSQCEPKRLRELENEALRVAEAEADLPDFPFPMPERPLLDDEKCLWLALVHDAMLRQSQPINPFKPAGDGPVLIPHWARATI